MYEHPKIFQEKSSSINHFKCLSVLALTWAAVSMYSISGGKWSAKDDSCTINTFKICHRNSINQSGDSVHVLLFWSQTRTKNIRKEEIRN